MKFQDLKTNQEFRTSNGRPAVKVSQDSAKALVPLCVSPSTNQYYENVVFKVKPSESVYVVKDDFYSHMDENIGKHLIITDELGTLSDHQEYNGEPLRIDAVFDGYYKCGPYIVSEGECEIID